MNHLRKICLPLVLLVLLSSCGEAFRSEESTLNSNTNNHTIDNGFRNSQTSVSVDEQILNSYASELSGADAQTRAIINVIRAFDFAITPSLTPGLVSLESKITFSCDNRLIFKRDVTLAQFQSAQVINLGLNGQYSVRVQCTNSTCNEIVAAIRLNDNFNNGTVLVGMAVNSNVNNSLVYLSRNVNLSSQYFAVFSSSSAFAQINSCPAVSNPSVTDRIMGIIQERATDRIISEAEKLLTRWFGI
jgi:hypothetical protein